MKKKAFSLLLFMALMAAGVQTAYAQSATVPDGSPSGRWYAGLGGGYQLSRLLSLKALATTRTKHLAAGRSAEGRLQGKNDHEFDQFK